jgi:hypothetical protein
MKYYGSEIIYATRKNLSIRIRNWGMKFLWDRERHYVTIPYMAVWHRLARLAPDVPDGWSFPDVMSQSFSSTHKPSSSI